MGNTCNRVVPTKNNSEENFRVKDQTKMVKFNDKNLFYSNSNLLSNSGMFFAEGETCGGKLPNNGIRSPELFEELNVSQKIYIGDISNENMQKAFNESIANALLKAKSDMDDAALEDIRRSQSFSIIPYVFLDT
jgi:hypothetical protein